MLGQAGDLGWLPVDRVVELRKRLTPKALRADLGLKEPDARVEWLKADDRARLCAALGKHRRASFRRIVLAALHSGQRLSNVIGLQKSAVDLRGRVLQLTKTAHFADGDHLFRRIAITRFGHHDRSEATLWSWVIFRSSRGSSWKGPLARVGGRGSGCGRRWRRQGWGRSDSRASVSDRAGWS